MGSSQTKSISGLSVCGMDNLWSD